MGGRERVATSKNEDMKGAIMTEKEMIEEMIEEMAKTMAGCNTTCDECFEQLERVMLTKIEDIAQHCQAYMFAKRAIEAGYRKILEDSVVVSKERYSMFCKLENEHIINTEEFRQQTRKETAKEILRDIKYKIEDRNGAMLEEDLSVDATILQEVLNEIAKQYGVEV